MSENTNEERPAIKSGHKETMSNAAKVIDAKAKVAGSKHGAVEPGSVIDVTEDGAELDARAAVENATAMTLAVTCDKLSGAGVPRSVIGSVAVLIGVDALLCSGISGADIHKLVHDAEATFGERSKISAEAAQKKEEANAALAKQLAEAAEVRRAAEAKGDAVSNYSPSSETEGPST